jgi:two-component system LytT family response regulator
MMRAMIVDDEPIAVSFLTELADEIDDLEIVGSANCVDEAVNKILDLRPDLVFLDIQMPGKNGFELIHEMHDFENMPSIIFITAYDEYAIKAIRNSAFDYLLKPLDILELRKAISRFRSLMQKENPTSLSRNRKISFKTRTGSIFINTDDVIFIKAHGNYSEIILSEDSSEFVTYSLQVIHKKLSDEFIRVGRSIIVNRRYVARTDRKKQLIIMEKDGLNYKISASSNSIKRLEKIISGYI